MISNPGRAKAQFIRCAPPTDYRFKNLVGARFRRLLVIGYAGRLGKSHAFDCRCDCGNTIITRGYCLTMGQTKSCGCLLPDWIRETKTTHGLSWTREWRIWSGMKTRCENANVRCFHNYGGAGVAVCERWLSGDGSKNGFECFIADMGRRPSPQHSIDRIDPHGDYERQNCRWATRSEQAQNTRKKRLIEWHGQTRTPREWSAATGIPFAEIAKRIRRGWSADRALTQPLRVSARP